LFRKLVGLQIRIGNLGLQEGSKKKELFCTFSTYPLMDYYGIKIKIKAKHFLWSICY